LLLLSALGFRYFSFANEGTKLSVEFGSHNTNTVDIGVGDLFQVQISIRNISGIMRNFAFDILWDSSQIQYVSTEINPLPDWSIAFDDSKVNAGILNDIGGSGSVTNEDHIWLVLNMRCIGPGVSEIHFNETSWFEENSGMTLSFNEETNGTVNQRLSPVGGVISPSLFIISLEKIIIIFGIAFILSLIYIIKLRLNGHFVTAINCNH
jgi:hypothetical protein